MRKIALMFLFIVTSFNCACAIKAADKITGIEKVADKIQLAPTIADKSVKNETKQTAARDAIAGGVGNVNDTGMIKDMIDKNEQLVEKLIASADRTIYILIIQFCILLRMFVRKDAKITELLIKFISENEARDDQKGG